MCRQITTNGVSLTRMQTVNCIFIEQMAQRGTFLLPVHQWKRLLALCDKTRLVVNGLPGVHVKASSCSTYPGKHSHRKEPGVLTHLWWQMWPSYIRHSSMSSTSTGPSTAFSPSRSSPMEKASLGYGLSETAAHGETVCCSHGDVNLRISFITFSEGGHLLNIMITG